MRGNRIARRCRSAGTRSIPAYAGEPLQGCVCHLAFAVYPRVCGGTVGSAGEILDPGGLSPRMRGNRKMQCHLPLRRRSIPAYAGEPPYAGQVNLIVTVYPRVCGGTRSCHIPSIVAVGLSPRMRGNPAMSGSMALLRRSIPAYAGEPDPILAARSVSGVYPRVCGGTVTSISLQKAGVGLSPRMRGNLTWKFRLFHQVRSIPAYAGEPKARGDEATGPTVYPRVCGGTSEIACQAENLKGLSPRMRGNRRCWAGCWPDIWSIPAYAGEPTSSACCLRRHTVYPRVCGGTVSW